jgi:hypothetical protein
LGFFLGISAVFNAQRAAKIVSRERHAARVKLPLGATLCTLPKSQSPNASPALGLASFELRKW